MLYKLSTVEKEIIYFIRWFILFLQFHKQQRLIKIRKKVVIVGNGLSTTEFPFLKMRGDHDFCCVNWFALNNRLFKEIKPRYYFLIDPKFFSESEMNNKLWVLLNSVDWKMYLISYSHVSIPVHNHNIKLMFINNNYYGGEFNRIKKFLFNRNRGTCGYQNVIVCAIFFFIMNRAPLIYLTGVENDWHKEYAIDKDNQIYREYVHFYGREKRKMEMFNKGEFYKCIYEYYITMYQYHILEQYAKANNVKIFNTTLNSYIDVFEKYDVEEYI